MKRRSIRWIVLGLSTLALTLQPAGVGAQAPPRGVYLALGDSLAFGVGATDPAQLGYVQRLFHFFHGTANAGVDTLVNVGVPGETSTTLVNGGQLTNAVTAINESTDVRVVTLDIGGNDLLNLLNSGPCSTNPNNPLSDPACLQEVNTALAAFRTNYQTILTQLAVALANDPGDETIMVMTYYNFLSGTGHPGEPVLDAALLGLDPRNDCTASPLTWGINDIIACVRPQPPQPGVVVVVADVYPEFAGKGPALTHVRENLNFHPNNAGYAIIANTFMRASR
jgi:lysophospholipase L1-like esterase